MTLPLPAALGRPPEPQAAQDAALGGTGEESSFGRRLLASPTAFGGALIVGVLVLVALLSLLWTPYAPDAQSLGHAFAAPSLAHPLGTDEYGRDELSRLMAGSRVSLYAGVLAVLIASLVGVPAGLYAAERGGAGAEVTMRLADLLFAFPALLSAICLVAALGASTTTAMIAIGIASVPYYARVTRAGALSVLSSEYVLAARAYGRSRPAILRRHVVPNITPLLIVQSTLLFSIGILAEAALSFLGLGTAPPSATWGVMLEDAVRNYLSSNPLLALWPSLAIAVTVLGFNLLGDGLRDVLDPRLRSRA
jgi:peptide/nickel transport system permease protein